MKKMIRLLIVAVLLLGAYGLAGFSSQVSAKQYEYDELNRLTAVDSENGHVRYTYDAGGNLLSAVHSPTETSSFPVTTDIAPGWVPYTTSGVEAEFAVVTEAVYQEQPQSEVTKDVYSSVSQDVYSVTGAVYVDQGALTVQKISARANQTGGVNIYRDLDIVGERTYIAKGLAKAPLIEQAVVKVVINYYDANGNYISHHNAVILPQASSSWDSFYSETTSPRNAVKARVHLQITILQTSGSGEAGFANVSFQPKRNGE